jgi:hypothetical protein
LTANLKKATQTRVQDFFQMKPKPKPEVKKVDDKKKKVNINTSTVLLWLINNNILERKYIQR